MTEELVSKLKDEVDNYEQTVHATISFNHLIRWDETLNGDGGFIPGSYFYIGRKMDTSADNSISPNNRVTPDIVLQCDATYGIVGEVKKSLPMNREYWRKFVDQLIKYDDNLKGWHTADENLDKSDIVLLTHIELKNSVLDFLKQKNDDGDLKLHRKFAYIVFFKTSGRRDKISFETAYGDLSNSQIDAVFKRFIHVPLDSVLFCNKDVKLYDSEPPLPYMMDLLWNYIFPQYISQNEFMDAQGKKHLVFETEIDELKTKVREQFTYCENHDARQPDIPKIQWIRNAMEKFVSLKYAEKIDQSHTKYRVKYRKLDSPLDIFCKEVIKGRVSKKSSKSTQRTLEEYNG
jgi:hypothetical protein